mmetsp:Transcript_56202/g.171182  ORF Transcript_56202/g.171182 Transcript_56202/m.171182 type:complete len:200 (+) Transcript_56202:4416-5015(+)
MLGRGAGRLVLERLRVLGPEPELDVDGPHRVDRRLRPAVGRRVSDDLYPRKRVPHLDPQRRRVAHLGRAESPWRGEGGLEADEAVSLRSQDHGRRNDALRSGRKLGKRGQRHVGLDPRCEQIVRLMLHLEVASARQIALLPAIAAVRVEDLEPHRGVRAGQAARARRAGRRVAAVRRGLQSGDLLCAQTSSPGHLCHEA